MVAVISCAAAAIWLILPDSVRALPALCTDRALISVVAAESISAPRATDCTIERITATESFSAAPNWPMSSVPLTTTFVVRSFCARRCATALTRPMRGAVTRVKAMPVSAHSTMINSVTPMLTHVALLLDAVALSDSSIAILACSRTPFSVAFMASFIQPIMASEESRSRASPVLPAASSAMARSLES